MKTIQLPYLLILISFLVIGCKTSNPFEKGQKWTGTYICNLDEYKTELEITEVQDLLVKGIISESRDDYYGSFNVLGEYNPESSQIEFKAQDWVFEPHWRYSAFTVDFKGYVLSKPHRFEGEISSEGKNCFGFKLKLIP